MSLIEISIEKTKKDGMGMNEKEELVNELIEAVERKGLTVVLVATFGRRVSVIVPYSEQTFKVEVDALDLSVRAINSLKRCGIFTLGGVVDAVMNGELPRIRNLGEKTENEIKNRILEFAYEQLNSQEKKQFFFDLIEKNGLRWLVERKV